MKQEKQIIEARRQKVAAVIGEVKDDLKHWEYAFKRMREWRRFARGLQWPNMKPGDLADPERQYVANITMRHLKQRTSAIYAKHPSYQWRKSRRLTRQLWDGTVAQLQMAVALVESGNDVTGRNALIVEDAIKSQAEGTRHTRVGETLTALYEYFVREQTPPAKKMMKKQVQSALTCGVAYFKQTFQRATDYPPEVSRALSDHMAQLAQIERLSADLEEGEIDPNSEDAEHLRLLIQELEGTEQIILREGLAIDYPDPTNIIPDRNMTFLPGFVGCGRVTEQYCLTRNQIREVYGVDVADKFTKYSNNSPEPGAPTQGGEDVAARETARVWEVWDKADNLVYTVCDGYDDFLIEPHSPLTYTERFYPWFVYAPNAVDDEEDPFPPSDVENIQPMQAEINRAGESLREHRWAARPGWVSGSDIPEDDKSAMESRGAHDIVTLKSLQPDEDIRKKFQPFPTPPIDFNLYTTEPAFKDVLRSVGTQEATLGGASGATATEVSTAESARQSSLGSAIDEFDDLLTEMARAGGQILLQEMSREQVVQILGDGAVWPVQTGIEVAMEIHLEAVAGSSGRPNQSQEVAIMERLFPILFQLPGISHEKLARHGLNVLDDTQSLEDWLDTSALPVLSMNGQMQAQANRGGGDNAPRSQGAGGEGMTGAGQDGMGAPQSAEQ